MLYTGVANGELDWALGSLATAGPLQRAGKIKFIAVTGPKRHPAFPEVPTFAESGGPAAFEVTGWVTLAAPKAVPKPVADKIRRDVEAALAEPDFKQRFATFGYEPFPVTAEQFNAFVASESQKYADAVKRSKASLD
jgi:tripartite-type tricarboxylate transporter receptor subunit TctC